MNMAFMPIHSPIKTTLQMNEDVSVSLHAAFSVVLHYSTTGPNPLGSSNLISSCLSCPHTPLLLSSAQKIR